MGPPPPFDEPPPEEPPLDPPEDPPDDDPPDDDPPEDEPPDDDPPEDRPDDDPPEDEPPLEPPDAGVTLAGFGVTVAAFVVGLCFFFLCFLAGVVAVVVETAATEGVVVDVELLLDPQPATAKAAIIVIASARFMLPPGSLSAFRPDLSGFPPESTRPP